MARILISHSFNDRKQAERILIWLRTRGFDSVLNDFHSYAGEQPDDEPERAQSREIARIDAVVLVLTDNWFADRRCFAEFKHAFVLGKPIVPLIENPAGEIFNPGEFDVLDLRQDRDAGLQRLAADLTRASSSAENTLAGNRPLIDLINSLRDAAGNFVLSRRAVLTTGGSAFAARLTSVATVLGIATSEMHAAPSPPTLRSLISGDSTANQVILPPAIDDLLAGLQVQADSIQTIDGNPVHVGTAMLGLTKSLPFLELNLAPIGPAVPYHLTFGTGASPQAFKLELYVSNIPPAAAAFGFIGSTVGTFLKPAKYNQDGEEETLSPLSAPAPDDKVKIKDAGVSLFIQGKQNDVASMQFTQANQPPGIITLQFEPPYVMLGDSGFGLHLSNGLSIDTSSDERPSGQTANFDPPPQFLTTPSDTPAWQGLAVRACKFFIPKSIPYFGGRAVDAYLEIGTGDTPGIDLIIKTQVAATTTRPGIKVHIECRDPTAQDFTKFIPTLVELAMTLPLSQFSQSVTAEQQQRPITFAGGDPVVVRVGYVRSVADNLTTVTLAFESQGADGILAVKSLPGSPNIGNKLVITAAALATAIIAEDVPPNADPSGVVLTTLLTAAVGASSFFQDKGAFVIHGVELDSTGQGLVPGQTFKLRIDYSVDVLVNLIKLGVLDVEMSDAQPMRVRNRNVILSINPANSGLDMFNLDFGKATMEIEDPGLWKVKGLSSIFDILGTRSGRGSMWVEVDLKFRLNLGPIQISGATIRATRGDDKKFSMSMRGLDASITVPAFDGKGKLQITEGGFGAELDVDILPLKISASATLLYEHKPDPSTDFRIFLQIAFDLPGPLPLANTGFGIYGIAGSFGINTKPNDPDPADRIGSLLKWRSADPASWTWAMSNLTVGVEAVVATIPDLGFAFNTKGGLFLTIPDAVVRAALYGKVISPRQSVTDHPEDDQNFGFAFKGVALVDPNDGLTIAMEGSFGIPYLVQAVIPLGAYFPTKDSSKWYINFGADGYRNPDPSDDDGRAVGPARVTVLPDLLTLDGGAYLLLRGAGIKSWPRGGPINIPDGFVTAFGFNVDMDMGIVGVAWASVHASADIMIATRPMTLAGFGVVNGSLNLGPFSIGVDAHLSFIVVEHANPRLTAEVCAHIDLFFTDLDACVSITIGDDVQPSLPDPDLHPLDAVNDKNVWSGSYAYLIDDKYRLIAELPEDQAAAPTVWPDTLINLSFTVPPSLDHFDPTIFPTVKTYPLGKAAQQIGNTMLHYTWNLTRIALSEVTPQGLKPLTDPLSAAWQIGKDGDVGKRPQAADLVLLTYQGDVWLNRLTGESSDLAKKLLADSANACKNVVTAESGWAVGYIANPMPNGFQLVTDPLSPDPCVSQFTAVVIPSFSAIPNLVLGPSTAAALPAPYTYTPAEITIRAFKIARNFTGELQLGTIDAPRRGTTRGDGLLRAEIVLSEPVTNPAIVLTLDVPQSVTPANIQSAAQGIAVRDNRSTTSTWSLKESNLSIDQERLAVRFEPTVAGEIQRIIVTWPINMQLGILGVRGISKTATAAAAARNAANQAAAQNQANAAAQNPPPPNTTKGTAVRCILDPEKLYQLDVEMTWDGTISKQDENGTTTVIKPETLGKATYAPNGRPNNNNSTNRTYFFRTAPVPKMSAANDAASPAPRFGQDKYLSYYGSKTDLFKPEMLNRHLLSYVPAQTELDRFRDDPLQAHFDVPHVGPLAKAYGFDLKLAIQRIDVPGDPGKPIFLTIKKWKSLQQPSLLSGTNKIRSKYAANAPCAVPLPGATAESDGKLAPQAWYELYVQALAQPPLTSAANGKLESVTFRTSRWTGPADMLAGIGWKQPNVQANGDIEILNLPTFTPEVLEGEDSAFEAALALLQINGWPPVREKRTSVIWLKTPNASAPSWQCAGVLIEAAEAIHRLGRVEITGLSLSMGPGVTVNFSIHRFDRSGSRLLYLTKTPFTPRLWKPSSNPIFPSQPPRLILSLLDKMPLTPAGAKITGSIKLGTQPSFASEV